jgi:FdhD protein
MSFDSFSAVSSAAIRRVRGDRGHASDDVLAVEEPLEIRIVYGPAHARVGKSLSITMRTPGNDPELTAGFLFTEGILRTRADLGGIFPCGPSGNVVRAELSPGVEPDLARLERHFYTSSSCGVCGKSSIEALRTRSPFALLPGSPRVRADFVHEMPARVRAAQRAFDATGGLHASALFGPRGALEYLREDVGRHNALDKVIGAAWLADELPLAAGVLLVSGRASFELVQKAAMAGIPVLAAVGAPSSLAVELAREAGMTLLGFVRDARFNIYCGEERVIE